MPIDLEVKWAGDTPVITLTDKPVPAWALHGEAGDLSRAYRNVERRPRTCGRCSAISSSPAVMPSSLLTEVRAQLATLAEPVRSAQDAEAGGRDLSPDQGLASGRSQPFCIDLWRAEPLRKKSGDLSVSHRKAMRAVRIPSVREWIERYVRNGATATAWHTTDLGSIENEPELAALLPEWTSSLNRWKRRAACRVAGA